MTFNAAVAVLVLVAATSASLAAPDPNTVERSAQLATDAEDSTAAAGPTPDTDAVMTKLHQALDRYGLGPYYQDVFLANFIIVGSETGPEAYFHQWLDVSPDDRQAIDAAVAVLFEAADNPDGSLSDAASATLSELLGLREQDLPRKLFDRVLSTICPNLVWILDSTTYLALVPNLDADSADQLAGAVLVFERFNDLFTTLQRNLNDYLTFRD